MKNLHFVVTIDKQRKSFDLVSEYWETRQAWGHESHLLLGTAEVGTDRTRYYNRTWEIFEYQSSMHAAARKYTDRLANIALNDRRAELHTNRLPKEERTKIEKQYSKLCTRICAAIDKANRKKYGIY